jgi:hypothetical protein
MLKGWAVTLVSALFALAAKDANLNYALITYIAIPTFWLLDGFFISTERQYRKLYDDVRARSEGEIDFEMDATTYANKNRTWLAGIISKTLWPFYTLLIVITLFVMFVFGGK